MPRHGAFPVSSAKDGLIYVALALRELSRDMKFVGACVIVLVLVATAVSFIAARVQFGGEPLLASWLFRMSVDTTVIGIDVYVYQHILGRYRKISLTRYTVPLCIGWSALFLIVGIVLERLSHPLDRLLIGFFPPVETYAYIHHFVLGIATAMMMVWIGAYPFLVLEKAPHPLRENRKIIRKIGPALVIGWVVIWYATWCLGKLIEIGTISLFLDWHANEYPQLYAFMIDMRDFLIYAVFILPAAATTTIAFLRGTGETDFIPRRLR